MVEHQVVGLLPSIVHVLAAGSTGIGVSVSGIVSAPGVLPESKIVCAAPVQPSAGREVRRLPLSDSQWPYPTQETFLKYNRFPVAIVIAVTEEAFVPSNSESISALRPSDVEMNTGTELSLSTC